MHCRCAHTHTRRFNFLFIWIYCFVYAIERRTIFAEVLLWKLFHFYLILLFAVTIERVSFFAAFKEICAFCRTLNARVLFFKKKLSASLIVIWCIFSVNWNYLKGFFRQNLYWRRKRHYFKFFVQCAFNTSQSNQMREKTSRIKRQFDFKRIFVLIIFSPNHFERHVRTKTRICHSHLKQLLILLNRTQILFQE